MPLDPTLSETNVKLSLIKYFTDTLITADGLLVRFNAGLKPVGEETAWIAFSFGGLNQFGGSGGAFAIFCCTRNDPDGISLSRLYDKLQERITDPSAYDLRRNIPIFNTDTEPWEVVTHAKITEIRSDKQNGTPDGTKYKIVSIKIWFPTI